ncbi:MAG: MFS transporter [Deltaproteobacteria bacterium]|nr:MFS transporter [Deltaproteobacteria bacterium]
MVIYGIGAFVNNTLAAAIGGMLIVLNLGLGMDPALVGLLGALPRLTDAITDPLMGYISDHTKSRWGRRRPYIFAGAIAAGLIYMVLWWLPLGQSETFYFVWFLVGSILFYLAYTIFATPWVAMGYELTPDYNERTRLMGTQNFIGQLAYVVSPWFLWFMTNKDWFPDQVEGARWLAIIIGVVVIGLGILPAIFLRERFAEAAVDDNPEPDEPSRGLVHSLKDFGQGLKITLSSTSFLKLGAATFLVFNGFILISSFQFYVIIYYVFGGDQELGSEWAGYSGTVGAVSTFIVITLITWLGTKVGKRRAFFGAIGVSMVGYALKWFCYNPEIPWLLLVPAPLMAFGLGGLFTLMGSMIADVVDEDELITQERREGMFGSIFWWVVKLGMAAALAGGGYLLNATGFDVELGGNQAANTIFWMRVCDAFVPVVTSALAIWAVWSYPITEETANATRLELERRRGTEAAPAAS